MTTMGTPLKVTLYTTTSSLSMGIRLYSISAYRLPMSVEKMKIVSAMANVRGTAPRMAQKSGSKTSISNIF
ncbi:hypothetical protein GALL_486820 [mine drainage metagenome]|uniref:Uncharacterized protein n=1 Tax=mine drainage metagenome TaxID=410659 RepID=A0A1J5PQ63_9ZZZZ